MKGLKEYCKNLAHNPRAEILSGITVGIALVPEAVAFAIIAGVSPLVGLYAAFIVCLITSLFGGRPGMISGATGALAVVMTSLVTSHGIEYLFATVVLMGIFQMIAGICKLGRFIKMVPHPVMIGFVNGLAIIILLSQFNQFKVTDELGVSSWVGGNALMIILAICSFTMAIIYLLPKLTTKVPSTLVAIIISTVIVFLLKIETTTVGDIASITGSLPKFHIPMVAINWETIKVITPYALILASIGLIESLLTLTLIEDITKTRYNMNSRECFFQGVANLVTGLFGGMGGCAMVGQSMINIKSGGRGRLSGVIAGISLLLFILFFSGLIELVPIATLVGVMFVVVIATFKWSSLNMLNKIPATDFFVIVVVTIVTIFTDLAMAVFVGVIISSLAFAWNSAKNIHIAKNTNEKGLEKGLENRITYTVYGQIFFASAGRFKELFTYDETENDITIDFQYTRVWDHSALEAIEFLAQNYIDAGKTLHLVHLSPNCSGLLDNAENCIVSHPNSDPTYRIATLTREKFKQ